MLYDPYLWKCACKYRLSGVARGMQAHCVLLLIQSLS